MNNRITQPRKSYKMNTLSLATADAAAAASTSILSDQIMEIIRTYRNRITTQLANKYGFNLQESLVYLNKNEIGDEIIKATAATATAETTLAATEFYGDEINKLKKENADLKKMLMLATNASGIPLTDAVGCILHKGKPPGLHECSTCRERKESSQFNYYSQRVDQHGYLMRSNALCKNCAEISNKERKETLQKANKEGKIPPKPSPGDTCPNCHRTWGSAEAPRNWHRDHDAIKNEFRGWLCGDCNMAQHDHRHGMS